MATKKKIFPHLIPAASSSSDGVQVADHHWDFLDEIEAPTWVDLSMECKFGYEDKDDEWFNISHPFHQLSSREIIAAGFARNLEGNSSPKVPGSVSKVRGKEKARNVDSWCRKIIIDEGKTSLKEKAVGRDMKKKNVVVVNSCKSSITSEGSSSTNTNNNNNKVEQGGPTSTIGLLSSLKVTLRKSCVTRQASRCEVNRKSVCSSVGSSSSSSNPVPGGVHLSKDGSTPESRNLLTTRVSRVSKEEVRRRRRPNVLVTSSSKVNENKTKPKQLKAAAGAWGSRFAARPRPGPGKENDQVVVLVKNTSSSKATTDENITTTKRTHKVLPQGKKLYLR